MYNILEISFLFVLIISVVYSYSIQDPIPTLVKVNHNNTISKWREVPIQKFPNFAISTLNIFQIPMDEKGLTTDFVNSRIPINLKSDLKISLNFDNSRLVTPWITIYDSIQRKSLKKLKVIFSHDEYEIIKITYETQCMYFIFFIFLISFFFFFFHCFLSQFLNFSVYCLCHFTIPKDIIIIILLLLLLYFNFFYYYFSLSYNSK